MNLASAVSSSAEQTTDTGCFIGWLAASTKWISVTWTYLRTLQMHKTPALHSLPPTCKEKKTCIQNSFVPRNMKKCSHSSHSWIFQQGILYPTTLRNLSLCTTLTRIFEIIRYELCPTKMLLAMLQVIARLQNKFYFTCFVKCPIKYMFLPAWQFIPFHICSHCNLNIFVLIITTESRWQTFKDVNLYRCFSD